ncbi:hypothetical protein X975_22563, partial [Stegodyphus mimosarum]
MLKSLQNSKIERRVLIPDISCDSFVYVFVAVYTFKDKQVNIPIYVYMMNHTVLSFVLKK